MDILDKPGRSCPQGLNWLRAAVGRAHPPSTPLGFPHYAKQTAGLEIISCSPSQACLACAEITSLPLDPKLLLLELGSLREIQPLRTYRLHQEVAHFLLLVPVLHTVMDLLQELLMVLQQLRDLVKDLIHQRWVTQQRVLWLLQRLHVTLWGSKGMGVPIGCFSHLSQKEFFTPCRRMGMLNMGIGGILQQGVPPANTGL